MICPIKNPKSWFCLILSVWSGLFRHEVSRVLGGVHSPGYLVWIIDDPDVGKRTLMLQIVAIIAEGRAIGKPAPILYVSGEEILCGCRKP
ncbi:hypothetical protein L2E82_12657 [Cichorium intybus]|uniref:Uncharacterized protein n=1 Tax=Cichorium intybus TaxID=13427 RepID=A0ACB9GHP9_CICIN|nr:hypothetical protein L2E82_12657 [Cichorium intybus]